MNRPIPKWIVVMSILIASLGLFVGLSLYFSPGTFVENVDFSSKWTRYLAHMWAARQIAIAAIIAYSLVRRAAMMLKVSLIAYCLMNFQDILIGLSLGDAALTIGASLFGLLSGSMIFVLSQKDEKQAVVQ
jgi:hypothetical protein